MRSVPTQCALSLLLMLGLGPISGAMSPGSVPLKATEVAGLTAGLQGAGEPGLACIQDALGGVRTIAGVTSLRIASVTTTGGAHGTPTSGTQEIDVVFPDRYMRDAVTLVRSGSEGLSSVTGFDRGTLLSHPRIPDDDAMMRYAQEDFLRQIPMRLPRMLQGVRLSERAGDPERLTLDFWGPNNFRGALVADRDTCMPVAFEYAGDNRVRRVMVRVDLLEYRAYGGVRFPTVLKTSHDGEPYSEERVSSIDVNAADAGTYFASIR